jgi:hypothetical protein
MIRFLLSAVLLASPVLAQEEDPVARSRTLYAEAVDAYRAGDTDTYRAKLAEAVDLRPHQPTLVYKLAGAEAISGNVDEAFFLLRRLAAMGVAVDPSEDGDLATLVDDPRFAEVSARFAANAEPVGNSTVFVRFGADDFIPESVAHDPVEGRWYIGSVHRRMIVTARDGEMSDFADREDGLWSVMGLKVDAERRRLWACTTAAPQGEDTPREEVGRTAVVVFDLDDGAVLARHELHEEGVIHWFGDLVLGADGSAYVTDSMSPRIYRVDADLEGLSVHLEHPRFASLQGITRVGDVFYVADYSNGIFRIAGDDVTLVECPADATLLGIDGLYSHGDALLAIQNGMRPHRVVRVPLQEDGRSAGAVEVLEANHPQFDEPTLGIVVDDAFYYVANSQWYRFDQEGGLADDGAGEAEGPIVLRLELGSGD